VARYAHGTRVATNLFEAAAWHKAIRVACSACPHNVTFNPHGLWWYFQRKRFDDDLRAARQRFWCRECGRRIGRRIRPRPLELVEESDAHIRLPMPDEREWKRAINRFRN